jgi:hypothetical protein
MNLFEEFVLFNICLGSVRQRYNPPDPRIPLPFITWEICDILDLDYETVMPMVDKAAEFAVYEHNGWL